MISNILVVYDTHSGNTKQMAEYVAQGAAISSDVQVMSRPIEEVTLEEVRDADGIAVGSPTNLGAMSWRMKKWLDDLSPTLWGNIDGKIACAFSSSGTWGGGAELVCREILTVLMNYGFLTFGVTDWVADRHSPHYGSISAGAPRVQGAQESCLRLGRRLSEWCLTYIAGDKAYHPMNADYPRPISK